VNQSVDAMGFTSALNACSRSTSSTTHWSEVSGGRTAIGTAEYGMDDWRAAPPLQQQASRSEA